MQLATERTNKSPAVATRTEPETSTLQAAFERLKAAYRKDPMPSHEQRIAWLDALLRVVRKNRKQIADTISADFGNRSFHETQVAEIFTLITGLRHTKKHLKSWMKPKSRHVMLAMRPGSAKVCYQPLGVVGVIAPWNYPFQLAVGPVAAALAAGNRVLLKPSEYTPKTSELIARLLSEALPDDVVQVVTGGPELGASFSRLPFDHLLFTGSTHVGRIVMRAAAENLTPVTLELGGKSPAVVHESFPTARAAQRVASGKWFNAGQTCIAPDYLMVPESQLDSMVAELQKAIAHSFPTLGENRDYTSVVNDKHYARLVDLVKDAEARGARKVELNPAGESLAADGRKLVPTLLLNVNDEMRVMQEEIFGPVLPILTYRTVDEAIEYINAHPRPLALYYFDFDKARAQQVLERTVSGGATVNDTLIHFAIDDLPFGGVGPSGIGSYHGIEGFETFSHKKGVFQQAKLNAAASMGPPYAPRVDKMLDLLIGK
ncbi:MAG: coniferyl aldehyde dehydrogenase [Polyangiales bacterium]